MKYRLSLTLARSDAPDVELSVNIEVERDRVVDPLVLDLAERLDKALASEQVQELRRG